MHELHIERRVSERLSLRYEAEARTAALEHRRQLQAEASARIRAEAECDEKIKVRRFDEATRARVPCCCWRCCC